MGKVTLGVLVVVIALGAYWFWWSDQGANNPITVEGTLSVTGLPAMASAQGPQKVNFTLQAVPNKLRVAAEVAGQKLCAIINLSKRERYILNESKKRYAVEEFNLVDITETKQPTKPELTWAKEFKRTADWDYIGSGEGKRFCNKQILTELPSEVMDTTKAVPGVSLPGLPNAAEMLKKIEWEMWFTPETRLGRRYFATLNKLARMKEVGSGPETEKSRPQFKYVNLDYFPIPMKALISLGPIKIELNVKTLSRKRIPKNVFKIPSDYKKVDVKELFK